MKWSKNLSTLQILWVLQRVTFTLSPELSLLVLKHRLRTNTVSRSFSKYARPNSLSRPSEANKGLGFCSVGKATYDAARPPHKTWGCFTDTGSATYKLSLCRFVQEASNKHSNCMLASFPITANRQCLKLHLKLLTFSFDKLL